jgi:hypothetical protein
MVNTGGVDELYVLTLIESRGRARQRREGPLGRRKVEPVHR